jgi:hypothetical protein
MSIVETDPSLALQGAELARLQADTVLDGLGLGDRVFDHVPQNSAFPYIKIGEHVVTPDDVGCGSVTEIISTVRVYSRKPGRVECKRFAERLRFRLTKESGFEVAGYRMVLGYCDGYTIEQHTDGLTHQAILEFRYRLEPVGP